VGPHHKDALLVAFARLWILTSLERQFQHLGIRSNPTLLVLTLRVSAIVITRFVIVISRFGS
jgi:hypothetical protein